MNRRMFLRRTVAGVGGAAIGTSLASGPPSVLPAVPSAQAGHSAPIFFPTGFTDLDQIIDGVRPGSILAIAGRRSFGKTTLAMNIAINCAGLRIPVAYFSAPLAYRDFANEAYSCVGEHPRSIAREAFPLDEDPPTMVGIGPLTVDDSSRLTPAELRRRLASQIEGPGGPLGAVIVDRPDLLHLDSRLDAEPERMAAIMQALRAIALELNVAIVVTADVGRSVGARHDQRPRLTDIRPAIAPIAQAADVVLLIYRDEACHFRSTLPGIAEIEVARNRYGPCGTFWLGFEGKYARFATLDAVADLSKPLGRTSSWPSFRSSLRSCSQ